MEGNTKEYGRVTREERKRNLEQKRRRKRRTRRKRIIFIAWQCIIISAIVFLIWDIKEQIGKKKAVVASETGNLSDDGKSWGKIVDEIFGNDNVQGGDYVEYVGLDAVDPPVKRTEQEMLSKLSELAEEREEIRTILEKQEAYPVNMLEALANNLEMTDFVMGYLTAENKVTGGLTESEKNQEHPLLLQWDPRWGYLSYGDDSNIGLAGCGPTCLSMALYELTRDATLTPDKIAAYGMENNYYMPGTGTLWTLIEEVPRLYGIQVENPVADETILKRELDAGKVLICAMRPGDFTSTGHFIVVYGYNQEGFLVNDPNCVSRSKKSWPFEQIGWQMKQVWALGK